jgi:hypothetical protein
VTVAEKVVGLTTKQQAEIAEQLRGGGEPREVVHRFLAAAPRRAKKPNDATKLLVQALRRALADLCGRVEEVRWITARDEKALRAGARLIRRLQKQARAVDAADAALDDLSPAEEVAPGREADEAEGGPADAPGPDNLSGGSGRRPGLGGNSELSQYSATSGGGPGRPGDRPGPGQGAGRRAAREPSRPGPTAKKGRARP